MSHYIAEPCIDVKDKACVEVCPVDCIHSADGERQFYINPEECIDCGACVEVCPVQAIFPEEDLPEKWKHFVQINAGFFKRQAT
jgi:ferredoxin